MNESVENQKEGMVSNAPYGQSILKDTFGDTGKVPTTGFFQSRKKTLIIGGGILFIIILLVVGYFLMPAKITKRVLSEAEILEVIRSEIIPSIVNIRCFDTEGNETWTGTGAYDVNGDGVPLVETNAHVVLDDHRTYNGCNIYFPRKDGSFYDSAYNAGDAFLYHNLRSIVGGKKVDGIDYAVINLGEPYENPDFGVSYPFPPQQIAFSDSIAKTCASSKKEIRHGDKVYIIGYPDAGGETLTLAEGIVSGFSGDYGEFIKVSANTSFGNSGGIAIGASDGCYYGIPTQIGPGGGYNIGLVLSPSFISDFVTNSAGEKTYVPNAELDNFVFYTNNTFGITIRYPKEWIIQENPMDDETVPVQFVAPKESVFDNYDELVLLQIIENRSNGSLQNYFKEYAAYLKKNTADFVILGQFPYEDNLSNLPGMLVVYHTGVSIVSEFLFEGNGRIFSIREFLPDDDSSSTTYLDILEVMARSFIIEGSQVQKEIPFSFSNFNSLFSTVSWPIFTTKK